MHNDNTNPSLTQIPHEITFFALANLNRDRNLDSFEKPYYKYFQVESVKYTQFFLDSPKIKKLAQSEMISLFYKDNKFHEIPKLIQLKDFISSLSNVNQ
jgi:hypothetical protein